MDYETVTLVEDFIWSILSPFTSQDIKKMIKEKILLPDLVKEELTNLQKYIDALRRFGLSESDFTSYVEKHSNDISEDEKCRLRIMQGLKEARPDLYETLLYHDNGWLIKNIQEMRRRFWEKERKQFDNYVLS